jgi:hypothetical protein
MKATKAKTKIKSPFNCLSNNLISPVIRFLKALYHIVQRLFNTFINPENPDSDNRYCVGMEIIRCLSERLIVLHLGFNTFCHALSKYRHFLFELLNRGVPIRDVLFPIRKESVQ